MQRGQIFLSSGAWFLRYWNDEVKDGQIVRRRACKRLATYGDAYRSKKDVLPLAEEVLSPVNTGQQQPESSLMLSEFVEKHFLPHIEKKIAVGHKKPSTLKFYKDVYKNHLKDSVGHIRIRDFTTRHAQDLLDGITGLKHQSLLRIKTGMSAIFTFARQRDVIRTANPIQGVKAEGKRTEPDRYAYSLDEVKKMLTDLPEPARTVCAVAAFSGLRAGEIRGLRWYDYKGGQLHVSRSVWRTHVGETKTDTSRSAVPVIPLLGEILDQHRKGAAPSPQGYIFAGEKQGRPLHLDNLSRRVIIDIIGDRWHGWHAFRRGLGTNLHQLGVQPEVIQRILRHADVATTQASYIVVSSESQKRAMKEFSRVVDSKWTIKPRKTAKKPTKPR